MARTLKVYEKTPTGEILETKGGNQKTLNELKAEHVSATIEFWLAK